MPSPSMRTPEANVKQAARQEGMATATVGSNHSTTGTHNRDMSGPILRRCVPWLRAGDAIIMDGRTLHRGLPNRRRLQEHSHLVESTEPGVSGSSLQGTTPHDTERETVANSPPGVGKGSPLHTSSHSSTISPSLSPARARGADGMIRLLPLVT